MNINSGISHGVNLEPQTDIDVMPLTSMALIILLILMIISAGITNRNSDITLPLSETAEEETSAYVTVTLLKNGRIELDGKDINFSELEGKLRAKFKAAPENVLLIRADKTLLYCDIEPALQIGRACGAAKIAIGAEKKK